MSIFCINLLHMLYVILFHIFHAVLALDKLCVISEMSAEYLNKTLRNTNQIKHTEKFSTRDGIKL